MMNPSDGICVSLFALVLIAVLVPALQAADDVAAGIPVESVVEEIPAVSADSTSTEDTLQMSLDEARRKSLEKQLQEEQADLQRLRDELEVIKSAPLPEAEAKVLKPGEDKPVVSLEDVPAEPAEGADEEMADALFALGEHEKARLLYERIVESKPGESHSAWARFQIGNCARRQDNLLAALKAYEALMNESPENRWSEEAAWWCAQIKWWLVWKDETVKQNAGTFAEKSPSAG